MHYSTTDVDLTTTENNTCCIDT